MKIKQLLITLIISLFTLSAFAASSDTQFTPEQVKQIQKIVGDTIVANPQILVKASRALQRQEAVKMQKMAMQGITQNKKQIFNNPNSPMVGNKNGDAILVEFFDYQCGHCKTMNPIVQALVKKNPNLKVIFKEFPIFGGNSQLAAKAALAAANQGKYFEFHDALLAAPNPITPEKIWAIAKKVGLNVNKLKQAMKSKEVNQQLRDNYTLARALKIMGTPAFIISNKGLSKFGFVPGATSQAELQKQINSVLNNNQNNATNNS